MLDRERGDLFNRATVRSAVFARAKAERDAHMAWIARVTPLLACAYRKSNPGILMVQSAQDRMADNASGCLGGT
jgi:hypothetical protein